MQGFYKIDYNMELIFQQKNMLLLSKRYLFVYTSVYGKM